MAVGLQMKKNYLSMVSYAIINSKIYFKYDHNFEFYLYIY